MKEDDHILIEILETPSVGSPRMASAISAGKLVTSGASARLGVEIEAKDKRARVAFDTTRSPGYQYVYAKDCLEIAEFFTQLAAVLK